VTPRVWTALEIDPSSYPRTLQPFARATLDLDDGSRETLWNHVVSYGIVRGEFDHLLLERARSAGAEVLEAARVSRIERRGDGFAVVSACGEVTGRVIVGAAGHHCPVARTLGEVPRNEAVVVTRESETRLGRDRLAEFAPRPGVPELFPEPDLRGYGWYFAKGDFLNVGIGALDDGRGLHRRTQAFLARLQSSGRLPREVAIEPLRGHAYALAAPGRRRVAGPGFFLAGDAAGLARSISGEGIGPAVDSGRLAADYAMRRLAGGAEETIADEYRRELVAAFGSATGWWSDLAPRVPARWVVALGRRVCKSAWLRRRLVFEAAFGMG
jgi:flavin-dependent dehydrogenase